MYKKSDKSRNDFKKCMYCRHINWKQVYNMLHENLDMRKLYEKALQDGSRVGTTD